MSRTGSYGLHCSARVDDDAVGMCAIGMLQRGVVVAERLRTRLAPPRHSSLIYFTLGRGGLIGFIVDERYEDVRIVGVQMSLIDVVGRIVEGFEAQTALTAADDHHELLLIVLIE